jgi:putative nucleotidyltransferase with HDIG domain
MKQIKLSELTIKKIKNGEFEKLIPELYKLKDIVENNPWHNEESVFDHTISVLNNLEKIIRTLKKKVKQDLNKIIEKHSRKDLLIVATLFHDIGKGETIISLDSGVRCCPDHERVGAKKIEKILRRFNLSKKESKIITDIVRNHGVIHDIVGLRDKDFRKDIAKEHSLTHAVAGLEKKDFQKEYKNFKKKFPDIYLELILLAFADTVGSYLKKTKPAEFRHRINFYKKELKALPYFK